MDLTIIITNDVISLSVIDENGKPLSSKVVLTDYVNYTTSELINKFKSEPEFGLNFRKVLVTVDTNLYCAVPNDLSDQQQLSALLSFQFPEIKPDKICVLGSKVENQEIRFVFTVQKNIYEALNEIFEIISIRHEMCDFVSQNRNSETSVFVRYKHKKADIIVFENNQLVLSKCFNHSTDEDFLYNILSVFEVFRYKARSVPVVITDINNQFTASDLLKKHILQVYIQ